MPASCALCGTRNRDNAMFCLGCAARLPAFAPTGPSALNRNTIAFSPRHDAWPPPERTITPELPAETAGFWIRLGIVLLLMGLAFLVWYAFVTRTGGSPPVQAESVAAPPSALPAIAAVTSSRPPPVPASVPAAPEPLPSRESNPAPTPRTVSAPPSPAAHQPRPDFARRVPAGAMDPSTRARPSFRGRTNEPYASALDPTFTCSNLDYVSMRRCLQAQCSRAEYRGHPRCAGPSEREEPSASSTAAGAPDIVWQGSSAAGHEDPARAERARQARLLLLP